MTLVITKRSWIMSNSSSFPLTQRAGLAIVLGWSIIAAGDETGMKPESPFTARYLAIQCKAPNPDRMVMADASVRSIGKQTFIVGKIVDLNGQERCGQVTTWLPVDEIMRIREFDDPSVARMDAKQGTESKKPSGDAGATGDVTEWDDRSMRIPIDYNPEKRQQIDKLRLLVSIDKGKTWKKELESGSDQSFFKFDAPRDGEYWFCLQVIDKTGKTDPTESALVPALKVRFRAKMPSSDVIDPDEIPRRIEPAKP
jgi:hypothetical protein